ncbi:MAG: TolC family protein [Candidatus Eremiobacteraeota bacterium]|nr:TolC family protein [Candidatus Eremiobacteraeota bacterium]
MSDNRRAPLGLGAFALAITGVVAFAGASVGSAAPRAGSSPRPGGSSAPLNGGQPTPYPLSTLAPLTGNTSLPYPAYGSPVPGVDSGLNVPDVPQTISLQQSILIAFARNPQLASARGDVGVQEALVRLERAGLLPSFSAAVSLTHSHNQPGAVSSTTITSGTPTTGASPSSGASPIAGATPNPGQTAGAGTTATTVGGTTGTTTGATTSTTTTTQYYNPTSVGLSLALSQLIYDGGRIAAGVNAAKSAETSSADTYRRDLQTIAYNVAVAYYNYLAAERTTQVDLEIVREDQVQEDLVRAQVRAGTEARAQIATAQLPTAQARLAVVRAQGSELSNEAAFSNAMGLDANIKAQPVDDAPVFTSNTISSIPVPTYDMALKRALAIRPDYDSAIQLVRQAEYSVKAAKLGLFPTLAAQATAADNSSNPDAGAFRNAQSIALSLSIPIYDQGVTSANVAEARSNLDIANATLKTTGLGVALNIKQTLVSLVSARAAFTQTEQEYATAVTNLQSTQAQYRAGVTTLPLLLNAQVQLTQALTDQVTAVYTLRQAEQAYLYAVGSNYDVSAGLGSPNIGPSTPTSLPPVQKQTSHASPGRRTAVLP